MELDAEVSNIEFLEVATRTSTIWTQDVLNMLYTWFIYEATGHFLVHGLYHLLALE